ncbi:GT2 family glycosyltransferase [Friedmanniella endophytica]|uniref:GT2 family glycosyltransferase n=1 Tax=Microlunatus kandeliicorticis TaxID=1759536 RepID=A0A7W3IP64_9ACTN|nr:glycosyltransferase family 2 protein [Microlunatus kandeliicorticis]MBA8792671.1 GT2 family glycosyltransferase [Microlunatus kandeliicorticis]
MAHPEGRLAVVIVNYGSHALLEELQLPQVPWLEVVVVDNLHTPASREAALALCSARGWTCLPQPANLGFGGGVNAGLRYARERGFACFLLLNPDARMTPEALSVLRDRCLQRPDALISPVMVTSTGRRYFRGSQLDLRSGRTRGGWSGSSTPEGSRPGGEGEPTGRWVDWLTGACLAFHRDVLDHLDGFDEPYFLYWEDVDFSVRAVRAGLSLVLLEDLTVVHDEGGTHRDAHSGRDRDDVKSAVYYRYNCRNRLLFGARHLDRGGLVRWIVLTPRESWQILCRGGRRHLLTHPAHLRAGVRGSLEGMLVALRALLSRRRPGPSTG